VLPPPPPGPLLFEAEDFTPEGAGWSRGAWGENYFSGPFANTFLSRKAFLGAASGAGGAVARLTIRIPARGHYLPLVRYEYLYRFAATFRLRVEQGVPVRGHRREGVALGRQREPGVGGS
jgi:hypothetical protein